MSPDRLAAELRQDAATLRSMADALDARAAGQDQLARQAAVRRSLANARYAEDVRPHGIVLVDAAVPEFPRR